MVLSAANVAALEVSIAANPKSLKHVPPRCTDYARLARLAVVKNGSAVGIVPSWRPEYAELVRLAIENHPCCASYALECIPVAHPEYKSLALLALSKSVDALRCVPSEHPCYEELAKAAIASPDGAGTLSYVPPSHACFARLAKDAIQVCPWQIECVPCHLPEYDSLARAAVESDGHSLALVPSFAPGYEALALHAIRAHEEAMQYVPEDIACYESIVRAAVLWKPDVVFYLRGSHPVRAELLAARNIDPDEDSDDSEDGQEELFGEGEENTAEDRSEVTAALRVVSDELFELQDEMPQQTYLRLNSALRKAHSGT